MIFSLSVSPRWKCSSQYKVQPNLSHKSGTILHQLTEMLLSPGLGSDSRKRRIRVGWVRTTCSSYSVCFGKHCFRGLLLRSQSFCDEAQKGELKSEVIKENLPGTIHNLPTKQPVILTAIYKENTFQGFLGSLTATSASTKQHSASVFGGWVFHEATERCLSTVQGRYCT